MLSHILNNDYLGGQHENRADRMPWWASVDIQMSVKMCIVMDLITIQSVCDMLIV